MDRIDKIMQELKRNNTPHEQPMPGPCGINYYKCPGPKYPEGYKPKKDEDKCTGCTINPSYKGA